MNTIYGGAYWRHSIRPSNNQGAQTHSGDALLIPALLSKRELRQLVASMID